MRRAICSCLLLSMIMVTSASGDHLPATEVPVPPIEPMQMPTNGHYYDVVGPFDFAGLPPAISWESAFEHAEEQFFQGAQGHLATVTSGAENYFIEQKILQKALEHPDCLKSHSVSGFNFEFGPWIGGTRLEFDTDPNVGVVGEDFFWVDTRDPFSTMAGDPIDEAFIDWIMPPEPNGQPFVTYLRFSEPSPSPGTPLDTLGWGDCNSPFCQCGQRTPACYVIEFDLDPPAVPAGDTWSMLLLAGLLMLGIAAAAWLPRRGHG